MRPTLVTAMCLLSLTACAHKQESTTQANATQAEESTGQDPGTMRMTSVEPQPMQERGMDEGQSTAALPEQPVDPSSSLGSSEQPLSSPQPLNPTAQPAAQRGTATAPTQNMEQSSGAERPAAIAEAPVPPGESKEAARAPTPDEIQLRERIQSSLSTASNLSYSARHVSIAVNKQEVTLIGDVKNQRERSDVENLVQKIQGVRRVKNQLSVVDQTMAPRR